MKEAELKAFLAGKGIEVDDCPDINSLIDRAAATEEAWSAKSAAAACQGGRCAAQALRSGLDADAAAEGL
eukprot:CAMPEP_0175792388 /NCGR_PEP_ID=MMETSP0097-20121207/82938_1 /TAXON_ID=311494 /ORGANISM="Alexandrium monilatum, Strain CCMP3105" /LENGTH=69 /DNA_ID=CAMNT_0017103569 /DNA_START=192 /DNA_END=398 /DNA_ORIENTATION=+